MTYSSILSFLDTCVVTMVTDGFQMERHSPRIEHLGDLTFVQYMILRNWSYSSAGYLFLIIC